MTTHPSMLLLGSQMRLELPCKSEGQQMRTYMRPFARILSQVNPFAGNCLRKPQKTTKTNGTCCDLCSTS